MGSQQAHRANTAKVRADFCPATASCPGCAIRDVFTNLVDAHCAPDLLPCEVPGAHTRMGVGVPPSHPPPGLPLGGTRRACSSDRMAWSSPGTGTHVQGVGAPILGTRPANSR